MAHYLIIAATSANNCGKSPQVIVDGFFENAFEERECRDLTR